MKTKSSLFIACHFIKTIKAITVSPYPAFISKQQFPFPYLLSDLPIVSGLKHHLCVCGMFTPLRLCIKLITFDVVIKTQSGKMTMAWNVWTVEERNMEVSTGAYMSCIRKFLQVTWRVVITGADSSLCFPCDTLGSGRDVFPSLTMLLNCTHSYQTWGGGLTTPWDKSDAFQTDIIKRDSNLIMYQLIF